MCGNKEALVAYLYGECSAAERDALDTHLLTCLTCATELREMRGVRMTLGEWTPPETALGFRIVSEPVPRARRFWPVPAGAQAAAAVFFVVAGAAAMANLEIRYDAAGVVVRTGWTRSDQATSRVAGSGTPAAGAMPAAWRSELDAVADQLRREFAAHERRVAAAAREDAPRAVTVRSGGGATEADVLRRVEALIDQSEQRQQREMALRLQQLVRDVDRNRRTDLALIEQSFGLIQGQTGRALTDLRDSMTNYVVRTSQRQPQ